MTDVVAVGDLVADKYRVERVLGRGGMGVVVAALHVNLGQRVALKFLLPSVDTSGPATGRFEREARAAVALHSEHVTRVLDVGRLPDGAPYIVMEMLDGSDLAQELRTRKRLPAHEAVTYILQACDAISEAHGLGIIHRDIKPANLFLAKRPKRAPIVKVLDFGISRATSLTEGVADLTSTHELIGSPLYMSPEQLRAPKTVDARSDIWSLGATLFELLSGEPAFDGETMAELSAHIMMKPLVGIRSRKEGADVSEELAAVIARCLEKEPADRYATIDELAVALAPFAQVNSAAPAAAVASPSAMMQNPMATTTQPPAAPVFHAAQTLPLLPGASAPPARATSARHAEATSELPAEADPRATSEAAVSYPPHALPMEKSRRAIVIGGGLVVATGALAVFLASREPAPPASQPSATSATSVSALPATSLAPPASATPAAIAPDIASAAPPAASSAASTASHASSATIRTPRPPAVDAHPAPIASASSRSASSASASASASAAPKGSASPLKLNLE